MSDPQRPLGPEDTRQIARLVVAARSGEDGAFAQLYVHFHRRVVRRLCNLIGPDAAVDDAAQEVFLRAYRAVGSYRGDAPFEHWLLRIASNVARDEWRRRWFYDRVVARVSDPQLALRGPAMLQPADECFAQLRLLHRALSRLSARLRESFLLCELEGLTLAEISAELGIPLNTAASRVRRARTHLRRLLGDSGAVRGGALYRARREETA